MAKVGDLTFSVLAKIEIYNYPFLIKKHASVFMCEHKYSLCTCALTCVCVCVCFNEATIDRLQSP